MKLKNKIVAVLMSAICAMSLVACGIRESGEGELNKPVDNTKTQLSVFNFDGGYGSEWLKKARDRFEAEYAEESFEDGKKGVQISISPQKISGTELQSRIPNMAEEVFFGERLFYNDYAKAGLLLDITDIVKDKKLPGEQKTIKDKMTDDQYSYFAFNDDGSEKVYGIPHYSGAVGIIYNADFFDDNVLYFKQDWKSTPNSPFTAKTADDVSNGPDGLPHTDDDGLPVTYEEFYKLCDYIADNIPSSKPLLWNGVVYDEYLLDLMCSMYMDYEGAEQGNITYTLNGNVKHIVDTINNGEVTLKAPFDVTPNDRGYEVFNQAGKYYATEFVGTILGNSDWYDKTTVFSQSYSHLEAQKNFLSTEEFGGKTDFAMFIDGCWWESECDSTITKMVQSYGNKASKYERNFKWMPLPRPTASEQKAVMLDSIQSCAFIKSSIAPSKIKAAKAFLQFVNTDESLIEFTNVTNTAKALNYTMTDKSQLSNFGRSYITAKEKSDIVCTFNGSDIYRNNAAAFAHLSIFKTKVDGTIYDNPVEPLRNGVSAKIIFDGYKTCGKTIWDGLTK